MDADEEERLLSEVDQSCGVPHFIATLPSVRSTKGEGMVLVVDDNAETAQLIAAFLRYTGCNVRFATNPAEIQTEIAKARPKLIILDDYMPGENGVELFQRLRDDLFKDIPVIFYSAGNDDARRISAMAAGAIGWFTKGRDDFGDMIDLVLRNCDPMAAA